MLSSIFALPGLLVFLHVLGKSEQNVKSIFILIKIILLLLGTVRSVIINGWKNPTRRYKQAITAIKGTIFRTTVSEMVC